MFTRIRFRGDERIKNDTEQAVYGSDIKSIILKLDAPEGTMQVHGESVPRIFEQY